MKNEANGKLETAVERINGLKDILNLRAANAFGVSSIEELDEKISDMPLIDLQKLAVGCGVSGTGNRMVLKNKIRNEFLKFSRGGHGLNIMPSSQLQVSKGGKQKSKQAMVHALLMEGCS